MHDLLEYKDKCHRCRRFIAIAVVVFALSILVLGYMWPKPKAPHTSPAAWQHFLSLLASGKVVPVKMALNAIEFRRNSLYLTGTSIWPVDKNMLAKDNWHLKKFANYTIEISRKLT